MARCPKPPTPKTVSRWPGTMFALRSARKTVTEARGLGRDQALGNLGCVTPRRSHEFPVPVIHGDTRDLLPHAQVLVSFAASPFSVTARQFHGRGLPASSRCPPVGFNLRRPHASPSGTHQAFTSIRTSPAPGLAEGLPRSLAAS